MSNIKQITEEEEQLILKARAEKAKQKEQLRGGNNVRRNDRRDTKESTEQTVREESDSREREAKEAREEEARIRRGIAMS